MSETFLMKLAASDNFKETVLSNQLKDRIHDIVKAQSQDVNLKDEFGMTALMIAIEHKNYTLASFIITDLKADVNIEDEDGNSAEDYFNQDRSPIENGSARENLGILLFEAKNKEALKPLSSMTRELPSAPLIQSEAGQSSTAGQLRNKKSGAGSSGVMDQVMDQIANLFGGPKKK